MDKKLSEVLKYFQIIFYLAFLFLWFKGNFPSFRNVKLSYLFALIPLIVITIIRIVFRFRERKTFFRIRFGKVIFALVALLLIATAVRVPFLIYNFGLLTSDDVMSSLVAKHISEGKLPPVYHYDVAYLGTFAHHIYALMFKIFGYSIFVIVCSYFIFYLGFIVVQFLFLKEIFSSYHLSLVLCSFYCLPIGNLLSVSFFVGSNLSLVLFLSSLIMCLSFLVYKKDRDDLISLLGFCLGLSFWIHPITVYFSICASIFILLKFRFFLKKYLKLIIYFFVGGFPVILNEIFCNLSTYHYLISGTKIQRVSWGKFKEIMVDIIFLISAEKTFFGYIYIFLIFLGIIGLIYLSLKKRKFLPENIFVIFFFVFLLLFVFSKFSADITTVRYSYPLYFALPFLLVSVFNLLRKKIKYIVISILFLMISLSNVKGTYTSYLSVKKAHLHLKIIIHSMETTGQKYWAGDYWLAILITGLSGERIIGYSYPQERYLPYKLQYFNKGENNNFVFFKETGSYAVRYKEFLQLIDKNLDRNLNQANNLIALLNKLDIRANKEKIGDFCWLIYDISSQIFPRAIEVPIPEQIPELELVNRESSKGYLILTYKNKVLSDSSGFRLHLEIPGYSSLERGLPSGKEELKPRIPFPEGKSFILRYYLNYRGTQIPYTIQEVSYSTLPEKFEEREQRIVYLSGFGPMVKAKGKKMRVCEKEVKFEINKAIGEQHRIRIHFYSPFEFSHPYWYGSYIQEVKIYVNHIYLMEKRLEDGENVVEFEMKAPHFKQRGNVITLRFKYHLPFKFAPNWKTSALLDNIEIK